LKATGRREKMSMALMGHDAPNKQKFQMVTRRRDRRGRDIAVAISRFAHQIRGRRINNIQLFRSNAKNFQLPSAVTAIAPYSDVVGLGQRNDTPETSNRPFDELSPISCEEPGRSIIMPSDDQIQITFQEQLLDVWPAIAIMIDHDGIAILPGHPCELIYWFRWNPGVKLFVKSGAKKANVDSIPKYLVQRLPMIDRVEADRISLFKQPFDTDKQISRQAVQR
jgi:hypothetical protein